MDPRLVSNSLCVAEDDLELLLLQLSGAEIIGVCNHMELSPLAAGQERTRSLCCLRATWTLIGLRALRGNCLEVATWAGKGLGHHLLPHTFIECLCCARPRCEVALSLDGSPWFTRPLMKDCLSKPRLGKPSCPSLGVEEQTGLGKWQLPPPPRGPFLSGNHGNREEGFVSGVRGTLSFLGM